MPVVPQLLPRVIGSGRTTVRGVRIFFIIIVAGSGDTKLKKLTRGRLSFNIKTMQRYYWLGKSIGRSRIPLESGLISRRSALQDMAGEDSKPPQVANL